MLKKIFSRTLVFAIAPQIPRLANILVLPLISPFLTAQDYFIYGTLTAYMTALSALRMLGFASIFPIVFFKYKYRWKIVWRQLYGYLYVWGGVYAILLAIFLYFMIPEQASQNRWLLIFLICFPTGFLENTTTIGYYLHQCKEKARFIGIVVAISGLVSVLVNYILIGVFQLGYISWFIALFLSALVSSLMYMKEVWKIEKITPIFKFRKKFILSYLKISLPFIPNQYSLWLVNSGDRVIMDRLHMNVNDIGVYNLAYTMGNNASSFALALYRAISPTVVKLWNEKTEESKYQRRKLIFMVQGAILGLFSLGALWMKEVFILLIRNDELRVAYSWAIIIVMSYALNPLGTVTAIPLQYEGKTRSLMYITFVSGLLNIGFNLLFLKQFGVGFATIATYIALTYITFAAFFLDIYKQMKDVNYYPLYWFLSQLVLTITVYALKDIAILYKIIISLILISALGFTILKNKTYFKM